MQVKERNH